MDLGIKGKKALVFGSSSGIGYGVAQTLMAEGALVYVHSRSEERAKSIQAQLGAAGYVHGDLQSEGEAKRCLSMALEKTGGVDLFVYNSGGPSKGSILEISRELKEFVPHMRKSKFGRVIVITSLAAREPLAGLTTSNGLRAGLSGLVKSAANELASLGITVNAVLPGFTNTERLKELKLSEDKVKSMIPMGRLVQPEEIGALVSFLCSVQAQPLTGQNYVVDGGSLASF
jgi:3-oxoacyl-[acyl-carrier protein] reductase